MSYITQYIVTVFSPLSLFCYLIIIGETTLKEEVVFLCVDKVL